MIFGRNTKLLVLVLLLGIALVFFYGAPWQSEGKTVDMSIINTYASPVMDERLMANSSEESWMKPHYLYLSDGHMGIIYLGAATGLPTIIGDEIPLEKLSSSGRGQMAMVLVVKRGNSTKAYGSTDIIAIGAKSKGRYIPPFLYWFDPAGIFCSLSRYGGVLYVLDNPVPEKYSVIDLSAAVKCEPRRVESDREERDTDYGLSVTDLAAAAAAASR